MKQQYSGLPALLRFVSIEIQTLVALLGACLSPSVPHQQISRWGAIVLLAAAPLCGTANALTWGTFGNWDSATRKNAADAAMLEVTNQFNVYGDFNWGNDGFVDVYYNAGVPTAQAGYYGSIEFGGTWPNHRVSQHELNHWLGSGTDGNWYNKFTNGVWTGAKVNALMAQFDGDGAVLRQSGVHYYPYGLNYDTEVINDSIYMRNVAITYAMRQDMGNGNPNDPWSATTVTLAGSDPAGASAFNWFGGGWSNSSYQGWNDKYFPHAGAAYFTGNYALRTPLSTDNPGGTTPSFTFGGDSLTVNNTNGASGGLVYQGKGTTGAVTFKNLILDGGYVRHSSGSADLFQIAGKVTLTNSPTIDAAQGNISISAAILGAGSLKKAGLATLTLSGANSYSGSTTINAGTLRLAATPVASYTFDSVNGSTVANSGNGGAVMNGTLAGGAAVVAEGKFGNAVSLASGASVNINSPIADLSNNKSWTVSAWVRTTTSGATILNKGDGSTWSAGNTLFYLGDGTAGGSGGVPSAVRHGGGFLQANLFATKVNDGNWHLVTYVNNAGTYAIYTDGVAQTLAAGNSGFSTADVGSMVRLGVTTNTVVSDGTVNFNGLLDNVQIFSQALSAPQVQALYQNQQLSPLPSTTNVTIASNATLDINGLTQQIGSLSAASASNVLLGAGQLTVSSAASSQASCTITGIGGSLVKDGSGVLTLTAANTYSGGTTVKGGTLRVNNLLGSGAGSGAVTVLSGATLGGSGTISGAATITGGGHVAPGASIGTLKVGTLNLAAGSILDFELDTVSGVDASDLIHVTSGDGLVVDGGLLNITNLGNMTAGSYTLLDYEGTLGGSSANLALGTVPSGFEFSLVDNVTTTSIELLVSAFLPGDFNGDAAVDAADYVVWRNNVGQPAGTLPNDSTGLVIGNQQYDLWRSNFGNAANAAGLGLARVPEPRARLLLLISLAVLWSHSKLRHEKKSATQR